MESVKNIEKLLERYFEATTTKDEELQLRQYFTQEAIAPQFEQYRPLFQYFAVAKEERFTKQIPPNPRKKYNFGWISVAASVALALGVFFGQDQYRAYQDKRQAEFAYQETKKALNLLAKNFEKGSQQMSYLNEFGVAKSKVFNDN
ncbi:MAG: hypothetical protein AAGF77_05050 [Bacteroidota bacterium]